VFQVSEIEHRLATTSTFSDADRKAPMPGPEDLTRYATHPEWAKTLGAVPREHFIPDTAWADPMGDAPSRMIDRDADPASWTSAVYDNTVIVTQIEDGRVPLTAENIDRTSEYTCSSSAPENVASFLELLDPYPGDRVLEIGTGTGWTAALLGRHVGDEGVVSVEVDEALARQARANLERAGASVRVEVADGAEGRPDGAPFDRVHVTCGVEDIPYAWIAQTRPGGVVVLPWMPPSRGYKLRLTVLDDGTAQGRVHGECGYMMLRSQRSRGIDLADNEHESVPGVDPRRIIRAGRGFEIAHVGLVPRTALSSWESADGGVLAILNDRTASHALVRRSATGELQVTQRGPRNLWDEAEQAFLTWTGWGEPRADRFGVTVAPEGQHVWLDSPDNRIERVKN